FLIAFLSIVPLIILTATRYLHAALPIYFRAPEPAAAPVAGDALRGCPSSYVSVYGYGPGCYGFRSPWRIGFYPGSLRYGRPYAAGYGYSGCADLWPRYRRSEEHTSELQSREKFVC